LNFALAVAFGWPSVRVLVTFSPRLAVAPGYAALTFG